eukprot:s71_g1.t6
MTLLLAIVVYIVPEVQMFNSGDGVSHIAHLLGGAVGAAAASCAQGHARSPAEVLRSNAAELFAGKQRFCQMAAQGRFKTDPGQDLYLSAEVPQATPLDSNPIRKKAHAKCNAYKLWVNVISQSGFNAQCLKLHHCFR